ncbi:MAG: hypothetical protein M3040_12070 [Bacteroidota bacterium]|nr:hypothetical protein [Bacteroidota bacterium]
MRFCRQSDDFLIEKDPKVYASPNDEGVEEFFNTYNCLIDDRIIYKVIDHTSTILVPGN